VDDNTRLGQISMFDEPAVVVTTTPVVAAPITEPVVDRPAPSVASAFGYGRMLWSRAQAEAWAAERMALNPTANHRSKTASK
jgi:hypothetical protein